jgi:hypothetical protein
MGKDVVAGNERYLARPGERFGKGKADKEGAGKPGFGGCRYGIDLFDGNTGLGNGLVDNA